MNYYIYPGLSNSAQICARLGVKEADPFFIMKRTCEALGLDLNKITSSYRGRPYTEARFIIVGIILTIDKKMTLKRLGKLLGGRDHATVIYSRKMYHDLEDTNKEFRQKVKLVKEFCLN
jgi:chromosomal replication initiator protein